MLPDSLPDAGVLVRGSHTAMLHVTLAHVMRRTVEAPRLPARAQRPGVAHEADTAYKVKHRLSLYAGSMSTTGDLKISSRGQMSLPASARHRWGLDEGGDVGYLDLGDAVVLIPGGVDKLRASLLDAIDDDIWQEARNGFGDPELADQ